jgi:hypothetical protein
MSDDPFSVVTLDSGVRVAASPPDPAPGFRGLLIAAPQRVFVRAPHPDFPSRRALTIPVCGRYVVDVKRRPGVRSLTEAIVAVAADSRWNIRRSGPLIPPPPLDGVPVAAAPPLPVVPEEQLRGLVAGGFFNFDLTAYVNIPDDEGCYEVWCELDEGRSNAVTIQVELDQTLFDLVTLPSLEKSLCSPRIPFEGFRGLLVRAPRRVVRSDDLPLRVPICGLLVCEPGEPQHPLQFATADASMELAHAGGYFNVDAAPLFARSEPGEVELLVTSGAAEERLSVVLASR